jgi:hypothetical protein
MSFEDQIIKAEESRAEAERKQYIREKYGLMGKSRLEKAVTTRAQNLLRHEVIQ